MFVDFLTALREGAPFYVFSFADKRGKFSKCAAGTQRAAPREFRTARVGEPSLDCWKAAGFSWPQVFSGFAPKNHSHANPRRTPAIHWLPPYPFPGLEADTRGVCSSTRSRAPPA